MTVKYEHAVDTDLFRQLQLAGVDDGLIGPTSTTHAGKLSYPHG
jgi:hypothetical protein